MGRTNWRGLRLLRLVGESPRTKNRTQEPKNPEPKNLGKNPRTNYGPHCSTVGIPLNLPAAVRGSFALPLPAAASGAANGSGWALATVGIAPRLAGHAA